MQIAGISSRAVAIRAPRAVCALPARAPRSVIARAVEEPKSPSATSTPEFDSKQIEEMSQQAMKSIEGALKPIQAEWDNTAEEEKPAAIGIIFFVIIAQIAIGSTIDTIDHIPVVGSLLEFIGIIVSVAFAYKFITEPSERETFNSNVDSFVKQVKGN